jgi:hypothetical protein
MLSDVTVNLAGRVLTLTGADLLVLFVVVFVVAVIIVSGFSHGRRLGVAHSHAADILTVQLARIGDTLDRIVTQNAALLAALNQQKPVQELGPRASLKVETPQPTPPEEPAPLSQHSDHSSPYESALSEPVRSVLSAILRP